MHYTTGVSTAQITRYVSPDGIDEGNSCQLPDFPCSSIQHAIDVAHDRETIQLARGVYTEGGLVLDKSLDIRGAGDGREPSFRLLRSLMWRLTEYFG